MEKFTSQGAPPVANFATITAGASGKFSTGVNDTGISDTGGKFASSVNDMGSK